ncbi:phosphoribosyl-ATP pyrophosphatase [Halpernia sp.]|uniref:phosphoribosyl-ATP pyrophosphatase n=1 Tax=Halpernia sp. TaxID=2782209 RepID=UPI003A8D8DE6
MANKYESLQELRRKKALLKKDILDIEDLLTFENTKESLSVLTHGFTDSFLKEETNDDGESTVSLNTKGIVNSISKEVRSKIIDKNNLLDFVKSDIGTSIAENAIKIGIVALVGNYAKKNLNNSSWKKKIIGLALVYLVPTILKFTREKLEEFQKNNRVSSLEQLI